MKNVLILGGTAEARELAERLAATHPDVNAILSMAGVTNAPQDATARVRRGGFGGAEGLAAYIKDEAIDLVVDATHPFAATISANAAEACCATGTPYLYVDRPTWDLPDAEVVFVPDAEEAARLVARTSKAAMLTIGSKALAAFGDIEKVKLVVRVIEEPAPESRLADAEYIVARPPFALSDETALMRAHNIDTLVTKASGGDATRAKLDAAAAVGARIVMLRRPLPPEDVERASGIDAALRWISEKL